jgi:hypothetical protein
VRSVLFFGFAFAVMADPVSSVAYAIEAALRALHGHLDLLFVTMALVIGVIALVTTNYWFLVRRFPRGGGDAEAAGRAFGVAWAFPVIGALIVDFDSDDLDLDLGGVERDHRLRSGARGLADPAGACPAGGSRGGYLVRARRQSRLRDVHDALPSRHRRRPRRRVRRTAWPRHEPCHGEREPGARRWHPRLPGRHGPGDRFRGAVDVDRAARPARR